MVIEGGFSSLIPSKSALFPLPSPSLSQDAIGHPCGHQSEGATGLWTRDDREVSACGEGSPTQGARDCAECPAIQTLPADSHGSFCPDLTERISANVQPIFNVEHCDTFDNLGLLFGCNIEPSGFRCGQIISQVTCKSDVSHKPYYKHEYCNDPLCPTCYTKFTYRIADAVVDRVMGYRSVYGFDPNYHLVFWPTIDVGYSSLKMAFADASTMLKAMGATMAVVWYHPYGMKEEIKKALRRYKNENDLPANNGFWELARKDVLCLGGLEHYIEYRPHFHAVASGYLLDSKEYAKLGLGGYKKVRRLDTVADLERVAYYITTHACYEPTKSTVRYFGKISYSKLGKKEQETVIEDLVCSVCGGALQEHYYNQDLGIFTGLAHDHLTRKVVHYRYFKKERGKKAKRLIDIWRGGSL